MILEEMSASQRTQEMVEEVGSGGGVMCFRSSRATIPYRRKPAREPTIILALSRYGLFGCK